MLNVFISYSPADRLLLGKLVNHLSVFYGGEQPTIKCFEDSQIGAGVNEDEVTLEFLHAAHIVLFLVSADFHSDERIQQKIVQVAISRQQRDNCRIVPILLRDFAYQGTHYEPFGMLPRKPESQLITAVDNWENIDNAFVTIVTKLRDLIKEINASNVLRPAPNNPQPVVTPSKDRWHRFFNQIQLKKAGITLLDTVNCNREIPYTQGLLEHFKEAHSKPGNLAYIISACQTQNPESLAKRLIYFYRDTAFTFFFLENAESDEVHFPDLVFGTTPAGTWKNFVNILELKFLPKGIDFEAFMDNPEMVMEKHKRVVITFRIDRIRWNDYAVAEHIAFLLEQLQALPETCQKFTFFFSCTFRSLHVSVDRQNEMRLERLSQLEQGQNGKVKHFQGLEPVAEPDIEDWVDSVVHPDFVVPVMTELQSRKTNRQNPLCDMNTVETMQYAAYTYLRDSKPV
jgi:hypothetical protein